MLPLREPAIWSPPPPTRPPLQLGGLQRFRGPHKALLSEQVAVCHMQLNFAAVGNNQIKLTEDLLQKAFPGLSLEHFPV